VAEALEGLVAALGRGEGDDVGDLAVVHRVLEPVGEERVAMGYVEGDVELEPLPDLALSLAYTVMGVDREAAQLDLHGVVRAVAVCLHGSERMPDARRVAADMSVWRD
jgi:hypothetical protein